MRIFIDFEFTGLHQHTTPVSLGVVKESGETFYAEFSDYDTDQVDEWLREHVISELTIPPGRLYHCCESGSVMMSGTRSNVREQLEYWLRCDDNIEVWGDCIAYDWVLFCELWDGALNVPDKFFYTPFDLCTLFRARGVDPDISRERFAGVNGTKHNALHDAQVIRVCWEKIQKGR